MIIIDGSHLAYRSFHTFPGFVSSKGEHTGMVYGFMSILSSYSRNFNKGIIICWDRKPYWRSEVYPAYKAHRDEKEKDENIAPSFRRLEEACKAAGLLQVGVPGFESDDVISFLVKRFDHDIKIVTGDKDIMQLVSDRNKITVIKPHPTKGLIEYDEAKVFEEYGVYACDIPKFLAIKGDKSDNIIGIKGLGDVKTARLVNAEGINTWGWIKDVYPLDYDRIMLNYDLTNLTSPKRAIQNLVQSNVKALPPDLEKLNRMFYDMEFTSIYAKTIIEETYDYQWVQKMQQILLEQINTRFQ